MIQSVEIRRRGGIVQKMEAANASRPRLPEEGEAGWQLALAALLLLCPTCQDPAPLKIPHRANEALLLRVHRPRPKVRHPVNVLPPQVIPIRPTVNLAEVANLQGAIPCHRCGVCCTRWQPLLTHADIDQIAHHLGIPSTDVVARFTSAYPFDDEVRLLNQEQGACIFLAWESDGRSTCTVHRFRPEVCRDWQAGLEKRECQQGFARAVRSEHVVDLQVLYPEADERAAFLDAVAAARHEGNT